MGIIANNNIGDADNVSGGEDIPLGLGMALAQNNRALSYFAGLSPRRKQDIIDKTHNIGSKKEMQSFVDNLNPGS